jgi:photosystem II stability/assembly factor-like uncharacterized protein
MKAKIFASIVLVVGIVFIAASQFSDPQLKKLLQGETNLKKIMKTVDSYYGAGTRQLNSTDKNYRKLKLWSRKAFYLSNRLDENGNLTNIDKRNIEALQHMNMGANGPSQNSSTATWSFIGPSSISNVNSSTGIGRVDRIAFHPSDPKILYVGTPNGGLWKSINDGLSWFSLTNNIYNQSISGVVVDYSNPNVIYLLTGDGDTYGGGLNYTNASTGVMKTVDGGTNWTYTAPLFNGSYVGLRLMQDPAHPGTLLAATTEGIFRTTNGGISWARVYDYTCYDIEYAPGNPLKVYAAFDGGIGYSIDGGISWNKAGFSPALTHGLGRVEIAVSANNSAVVYALGSQTFYGGVHSGVYRSANYGVTYTLQSNTPNILAYSKDGLDDGGQAEVDLALAVSPNDATKVITGATNLWSSSNSGSTMTNIMYEVDKRKIHPDIHELKYSPLNGALYSVNDGGIHKSTDDGATWTNLTNGVANSTIYHMTGIDADPNYLLIGLQDNDVLLRNTASTAATKLLGGDGFDVAMYSNANTAGKDSALVSMNTFVYKLKLGGGFSEVQGVAGRWFQTVALSNKVSTIMYVGSYYIFRSLNGGSFGQVSNYGSWSLAISPSNTNRVYAAGGSNSYGPDADGRLARTDDGGNSWYTKFDKTITPFNKITDVAVNPVNSGMVWLTLGSYSAGQKIYTSTNAGDNWTNVSYDLPNVPVNCVAIDASNNAYAGTDIGVFFKTNNQTHWTPFYNGMPIVPVTDLVINANANVIRASTYGRGIYSSDLYSICNTDLPLNSTYGGTRFYESSSTITSSATILGGTDTHVYFKSGNNITFTEGFTIKEGNEFKAYLGPCGNGLPTMNSSNEETGIMAAYHFTHTNGIEVSETTESGCEILITSGKAKTLKLLITDNANNVISEALITPVTDAIVYHKVSMKIPPGNMYRAILFADDQPADWQEIIR